MLRKRIISSVLAICAVFSAYSSALIPNVSFAADVETVYDNDGERTTSTAKQVYIDKLKEAKAITRDEYSADSFELFTQKLAQFDKTTRLEEYDNPYTEFDYNMFCDGISYAESFLVKDVDHTYYNDLVELISYGESLNESDYTEESWTAFNKKFESLKTGSYSLENALALEEAGDGVKIYTNYIVKQYYRQCFNLLVKKDFESVEREDSETGVKVNFKNNAISADDTLTVDKFDSSNWDWKDCDMPGLIDIPNLCSNYAYYRVALKNSSGNIFDIPDVYSVEISVPDEFDMTNLEVVVYRNDGVKGAISKQTIDKENRIVTVTFTKSFMEYANGASILIKNSIKAVDPLTLQNDGIYEIHSELTMYSDATQASMANAALDHNAFLVKNGDEIDVYLNFNPIYVLSPDMPSYCGGLWSERGRSADGDYFFDSETILSVYTNADGSIRDNDIYNGVTEIPCVKSIKLRLERESYNEFGGYTLVVSSPTMAAMGGVEFKDLVMDTLTCNLMLSEPQYIGTYEQASSHLPGYDYSALKRELQYADTLNAADYTAESWQTIETALKNAEAVNSNSSSAEIEQSVNELKEAVSNLVIDENKNNNLSDGRYLLNADMFQTDRTTKSMSDNAINHNVTLDVINGEYYVNVEFKGLTINNDFGYLSKLSYYDVGYTYDGFGNPKGTVIPAETLTYYDVVDQYNNADSPYPHYLRFKLVDKASGEYVPLQVFVPIMEVITEGSGTQNVLMQLDWSTLKEAGSASELNGYSISLAGDIGLNFFLSLSDEVLADSGAKVCITLPDSSTEDIPISSVTPGERGYQFTAHVAAKEMTSDVTVQVLLSDGTKGEAYTYSVKQYTDMLLSDANTDDAAKEFVKAMLNYGGCAQEYFSYNTENSANADLTVAEKSLDTATEDELSYYEYTLKGIDDGISYKGSKLCLESETAIKHYFALADGKSIGDYTFKVNGSVVMPVKSGDMYYITVENIGAQNLGTDYTVQVGKLRLAYSTMSYAYSALTKTDNKALQNVTKALYLYNQAADKYINS